VRVLIRERGCHEEEARAGGAREVKVRIKASGNANYKASGVKTVAFKVKVK